MIVSICNEKGGSGKSTLAQNIAIYEAAIAKKQILLVDTDPQKSLATFVGIRNEENQPKVFDFAYKFGDELKAFLIANKDKNVIIDTGGRDSREMRIAIALSDVVIIPTIPSQYDVSVLERMVSVIKMAKEVNPHLIAYIVINRSSPNPFLAKKIDSLKNFIKELECDYIRLAQSVIYEREKYKISTQMGLGVVEMNDKKTYAEIENVCKEIYNGI